MAKILTRFKAERDRRLLVRISQMAYKRLERDKQLGAFIEGAFFGTASSLFFFTLAQPRVKAVVIGFSAYVLFIVLRGLLDYNRKRQSSKG